MLKEALKFLIDGQKPVLKDVHKNTDVIATANDVKIIDLEEYNDTPRAIRRRVRLATAESFVAYVNRFREESTTVYVDTENQAFGSILDHHDAGEPRWCAHRATFEPRLTEEWKVWRAMHDKWLNQVEFALGIERLLDTIDSPEPSKVLQAALQFQSTDKHEFAAAHNLDNGAVSFVLKKGDLTTSVEFPHNIDIDLSVFLGQNPSILRGRIRHRLNSEDRLQFKFLFVNDPIVIQRDALLVVADEVRKGLGDCIVYEGSLPG